MKSLLILGLLHVSTSFSAEPPPSPREDQQKAFKQKLRENRLAQIQRIDDLVAERAEQRMAARRQADFEEGVHPTQQYSEIIPQSSELDDTDDILAMLKKINNNRECNCGKPKPTMSVPKPHK